MRGHGGSDWTDSYALGHHAYDLIPIIKDEKDNFIVGHSMGALIAMVLASCIFEGFSDQKYFPKIISKSLPEIYVFENGGREYLLNKFGLSNKDIINATKKIA